MKRIAICFIVAAAVALSGCAPQEPVKPKAPPAAPQEASSGLSAPAPQADAPPGAVAAALPEEVSAMIGGVTIEVDPMIEMLSIIQYLSDYHETFGLMTRIKTPYHDDVDAAFGSYKEHDAVQYFNEVMARGFAFDSPPTACLYLEKDFSISADYAGSDYERGRMTADMERFREVMEQFCADTKFHDFYEDHRDFYGEMIALYAAEFPQWDMTAAMEDYYGKTMAGYTIVLVPLFHTGGFGPSLNRTDGPHVYSIVGPYETNGSVPLFGDAESIADLVIHEFGHSFVPIFALGHDDAAMENEVERSAYLMEPIQQEMAAMAYSQWNNAYEELVLRAASIDILTRNTGISSERELQYEREEHFIYIDDVYQILQEYTENRDKYPVFDDFVPVITDYLLKKHPR